MGVDDPNVENGWSETPDLSGLDIKDDPELRSSWETEEPQNDEDCTWGHAGTVYEWDGEVGDLAPAFPEIEVELFGAPEERVAPQGDDFDWLNNIKVSQDCENPIRPIEKFEDAGLHPAMLENIKMMGYTIPTPIQKFVLPAVHLNRDVMGIAQTARMHHINVCTLPNLALGSGKTAAFLIPIINKLMGKVGRWAAPRPAINDPTNVTAEPLVVILAPTRELVVQIFNEARKFCYRTRIRPAAVYGGAPVLSQLNSLGRGCELLVGTPGRVVDFMHRRDVLKFSRVRYMVIDEADDMLLESWEDQLRQVMPTEQDAGNVSYLMFSATFPPQIEDIALRHLSMDHIRFRVGRTGSTVQNIRQVVIQAERHKKNQALIDLLRSMPAVRTIIFVNSKAEANKLDGILFSLGVPCVTIHANRTQVEREHAIRCFRSGRLPVLIATALTGRGLDVKNVMHVINYDLPRGTEGGIEEYVHRIGKSQTLSSQTPPKRYRILGPLLTPSPGRTGRIGHRGVASSLFTDRDTDIAPKLARLLLETDQEVPDFLMTYLPDGMTKENLWNPEFQDPPMLEFDSNNISDDTW
ncbi:ATP-dependent RNA helicase ded1 [Ceratocystis fimbriata CBS 114723]|uniref:RNA helicase n=1 Tax=Ceratocystis fimbriata CBS 114723 TaxID=1035309 RepID=A0A2C5WYN4_9PEZI|nr:ATP-dependent RNA helicase ded1 [Ceratocystis fimbriata CBS 114723]